MAVMASQGRWSLAPHLALIDEEIRKLVCREVPERVLVIRMPPRHGKSELISHWTPVWFESNWPDRNILLASYEATFASSWGRKARDSFDSVIELASEIPLAKLNPERQAANDWATTAGGYMATAGVGGPATGKGFHLGICDDLIKNSKEAQSEVYRNSTWEWLTSTFWTRREPEGVMIVVGTPWHRDDYLARLRSWNEPIREICLPAVCESDDDLLGREIGQPLWPERFDAAEMESIRVAQGPYYWNALYQQRPSQHEQTEWPEWYFGDHLWTEDFPENFEHGAIGVDFSRGSKKGDYAANVFTGWTKNQFYVDAQIERRPAEKLVDDVIDQAIRRNADLVYIEGNGAQLLLKDLLEKRLAERDLVSLSVVAVDSKGHKEDRIRRLGPRLEAKQFVLLNNAGGKLMVEQCRDFPLGDHDDGPDAWEMSVRALLGLAKAKFQGAVTHG